MPHTIEHGAIVHSPTQLPAETCDTCGHALHRVYPTLVAAGARLASVAPRVACPNGCVCWEWAAASGWTRLRPEAPNP
ncbi:MAG: hypothetical protein ACM3NQ_22240 [Bacteroidales bacterium]